MGPLLTRAVQDQIRDSLGTASGSIEVSLDLGRSLSVVQLEPQGWIWREQRYPFVDRCKDHTIYYWTGAAFEPIARYTNSLIKMVPTTWGPPTFEIDGIKMLPTAKVSPYEDAKSKVALIEPRGKRVLDTCGGLGYFAAWCIEGGAARIESFEKNADVLWLRELNPWSPRPAAPLTLHHADIAERITTLADRSFDAVLHDPPRFGIAGELYSQAFYDQLARVLVRGGKLFHYTGAPNKLTSGRDVPNEVSKRLRQAGFATELRGDGVFGIRRT